MPYKGERPLLVRMVISLSNEIFTYLRASPLTRSRGEIGEHDSRILGGGDFVAEILKEADQKVTRYLPIKKREALIKDVIQKISQEEGVGEKELRLGGQARRVSSVRAKVAWQLSREYGIPMAEIARHVGVCTSAIANALRKIEMENKK